MKKGFKILQTHPYEDTDKKKSITTTRKNLITESKEKLPCYIQA